MLLRVVEVVIPHFSPSWVEDQKPCCLIEVGEGDERVLVLCFNCEAGFDALNWSWRWKLEKRQSDAPRRCQIWGSV